MGPTKYKWDPHDLVGSMWILTNQRESVRRYIASIPLTYKHNKENKIHM